MLAPNGRTMAPELVIVHAPLNDSSLTMPEGSVPSELIVAVPVMVTYSPSDVLRSVVEAEAIDAEDRAFVERIIAAWDRR